MNKIKNNRVAAAVVSFNHKDTVIALLATLDRLKIPAFVTENASSDGTLDAVRGKNFSTTTILESRQNLGGTGGFNCAVLAALALKTDYIILIDDDAMPKGDCIDILVDFLDRHPEYVFAAPSIYISSRPATLQETGGGINFSKRLTVEAWNRFNRNPNLPEIIDIDYASACCLMIRSDAIRQIGVMDWNYFIFSDDVDWCLRLTRTGQKGACVTRAKAEHDFPWAKPFSPARLYYFQRNGLYMISKLRYGKNNIYSLFFALFRIFRDIFQSLASGDREICHTLKAALCHCFAGRYGKWENPVMFGAGRKRLSKKWFKTRNIQSVLIDITIEDYAEAILKTLQDCSDHPLKMDILCDWDRVKFFKAKQLFSNVLPRKHGIFSLAKTALKLKRRKYDLAITDAFMSPRRVTSHGARLACIFHDNNIYAAPSRPGLSLFVSFFGPVLALCVTGGCIFRFLKRPSPGNPSPEAAPVLAQLDIDPEIGQPWAGSRQ